MDNYFKTEIHLLRRALQEFAKKHPEQASMLNLNNPAETDPYVERLLEGVAFLTSQVKQKIDEGSSEIETMFLEFLVPQLLRPFPAVTIIQFSSFAAPPYSETIIKKGTILKSRPFLTERGKFECKFTTTSDVRIYPFILKNASVEQVGIEGVSISLEFKFQQDIGSEEFRFGDIRLYLHATYDLASLLLYILARRVLTVELYSPNDQGGLKLGGQELLEIGNLAIGDSLLPCDIGHYSGCNLLHEYFRFPQKQMFVIFSGLRNVNFPLGTEGFTLKIVTDYVTSFDWSITEDNIRLYCVPAINLYPADCEPFKRNSAQIEHQLVVDPENRERELIYKVDKVIGLSGLTSERKTYRACYDHTGVFESGCYYVIRRNNRVYLRLDSPDLFVKEVITCESVAYNGDYPKRYLREGCIDVPGDQLPDHITFSNIIPPTKLCSLEDYRKNMGAMLMHLLTSYGSLGDVGTLQTFLNLYNWHREGKNSQKIVGISNVKMSVMNRVVEGALWQVIVFKLTVDEKKFANIGDLHLFGLLLSKFLSLYAPINYLVETIFVCRPSNRELTWKREVGKRYPL